MPQLAGSGQSRSKVVAFAGSDADAQCNINTASAHADYADGWGELRRISWAWSGLAGAVLERAGSTKGSSNPKTTAAAKEETRSKGAPRPRRLPAMVIGVLPAGKLVVEQRRSPAPGRGWRRPAGGARVFASEAVETTEPVSPKVSCFGAVRSEAESRPTAPAPAPRGEDARSGCWASVASALRALCRTDDNGPEGEIWASELSTATALEYLESPTKVAVLSPPRTVLGLGEVKRLASRRWPDGMAGDGRCPPV
ncbi:uncharacterized protein LOC100824043 [Brachypodium distachyon]|uniref:Uncharacterized protein n=1 Tax=Brachypodium distachyon TaxID=15368 RepID=A0A0Q3H303_BRADI|nr:uncharacterized protein LOC100824043 [Brachypodium distachyon]KQJ82515.1 hypothetical protein BRADI_5g09356v3 [Brachypodium distachyon]|eukprot:XP_003581201.1 uncharacterized protein LOC100824043 [Brachypodium distachyon]